MKRGDFYEDDEPVADVVAAFTDGPHAVTAAPVRGWTYWLAPDMTLRELSTCGAPVAVRALREDLEDVELCQGCGEPLSEGGHEMSEYGGCV